MCSLIVQSWRWPPQTLPVCRNHGWALNQGYSKALRTWCQKMKIGLTVFLYEIEQTITQTAGGHTASLFFTFQTNSVRQHETVSAWYFSLHKSPLKLEEVTHCVCAGEHTVVCLFEYQFWGKDEPWFSLECWISPFGPGVPFHSSLHAMFAAEKIASVSWGAVLPLPMQAEDALRCSGTVLQWDPHPHAFWLPCRTLYPNMKAWLQKFVQNIANRMQSRFYVPNFIKKKEVCTAVGHKAVSEVVAVVWWY